MWNIEKLPAYSKRRHTISTNQYFAIKRALQAGSQASFRYKLEGFPNYDIVISNRQWQCVDTRFNDFPVLVWTNFKRGAPLSVHQPVQVSLKCFHHSMNNKAGEILAAMLRHSSHTNQEEEIYCLARQADQPAKQWETSNKTRLHCI